MNRRLVIAVRADPVICGHSGEARNLAEVALTRGFTDVRLLTWPIPALRAAGLPLEVTHLSASEVQAGGTLRLEVGPEPSRWGQTNRPPSLSTGVGP
ncbi:hypothetical protein SAMN05192558_101746 [Actinokineospora alba]|uniref:Uncharacterized protein n=1 Tax=Actinokineospora alba TaxID=504798 RepID=A0A1H0GCR6_9PSEU|nr:hypothetical protein [Actinokineospora alba]SDI07455.1 hypothetical protein SAMN05421871_103125 [Actinokineospora alba]SDO04621.1 hypothetical protein SAMN05192558_101746 [Actinokineospora alba]